LEERRRWNEPVAISRLRRKLEDALKEVHAAGVADYDPTVNDIFVRLVSSQLLRLIVPDRSFQMPRIRPTPTSCFLTGALLRLKTALEAIGLVESRETGDYWIKPCMTRAWFCSILSLLFSCMHLAPHTLI
jgi:hypothetical protein